MNWDVTRDLVIVGSGAGAICAGLVAKERGKTCLIVEKQAKVGGSTAFSGGIIWVPQNHFLKSADSFEKARQYLDSVVGDIGRASTPRMRDAFVRETRLMIEFLERFEMRFSHAHTPDYYSAAPGALAEGRSLISPLFDLNRLGEWAEHLARFEKWPPLPIESSEFARLGLVKRTVAGKLTAAKVAWRMLYQKVTGKRLRGMGSAVQGRMLEIALRQQIDLWRASPMTSLVIEGGRVTGIVVQRGNATVRVGAREGVLLNSGGFSRSEPMRRAYQPEPNGIRWTVANPGDTGEVIRAAVEAGAAIDLMDAALWSPASFQPDGQFEGFHVPNDAGKPHCIVVDASGARFANEAQGYVDFGVAMYAQHAVPAWAIFDNQHRQQYPWGMALPGQTPEHWLKSGYMKRASSIGELARQCGIDHAKLTGTIERFNGFVATGVDADFRRGEGAYQQRNSGDPTYRPNPNLGTLERAPFYAVQLWPGDVGTQGGLVVDELARVLREDGSVIPNLYATGNCTASLFGHSYPGAGASIAKSLTFAYIAARHALGTARASQGINTPSSRSRTSISPV
jgi:3-oxosteroid 1-dehydrogenase